MIPTDGRFDPEAIAARLVAAGTAPPGGDDGKDPAGGEPVPAAVLVPLIGREDRTTVLLTRRSRRLRDHAGQISFPGGRIEGCDSDPACAALRETEEEVGIPRDRVRVLGRLPVYDTATGFRIHPWVGWVEPAVRLRVDATEVEEVFEVPLAFVLDPANHRRETYEARGGRRLTWVLPFEGRRIWGATAGILVGLSRLLNGDRDAGRPRA